MSCKYADIFGKPKVGFHSYRLFNIAVNDVIGTLVLSYILAKVKKISYTKSFVIMLLVGEILHFLFCVDTTVALSIKNVWKPTQNKHDLMV